MNTHWRRFRGYRPVWLEQRRDGWYVCQGSDLVVRQGPYWWFKAVLLRWWRR